MKIDLRSDTVTKPGKAMLEAMMQAVVGDDVFEDDPTINQLQERVAEYFGMESALFFPSGSMANQVAIKCHTQMGDEVICDSTAHVYRYEGGGIAANSGASVRLLQGQRGIFTPEDILKNINSDDVHFPNSSLIVVENTVNKGGGVCWSTEQLSSVSSCAREKQRAIHLDGARLWNAMVYKKQDPKQFGQWFDSISVCFSKGLGCPVGSVLVGSTSFIKLARRHRKRFGGGMRQVGYLGAACLYALDHHIDRLEKDHFKALQIQEQLLVLPSVVQVMPVETNIVLFQLNSETSANQLIEKLKEDNIHCIATGDGWVRFVTHLDIEEGMIDVLNRRLAVYLSS